MSEDVSWDEDFEFDSPSETLKIPEALSSVSHSVQIEGDIARRLAGVIAQLRELLVRDDPSWTRNDQLAIQQAVSLIHASIDDRSDSFYQSHAWRLYKDRPLHLNGESFEQLLEMAEKCRDDILRCT